VYLTDMPQLLRMVQVVVIWFLCSIVLNWSLSGFRPVIDIDIDLIEQNCDSLVYTK